MLPNNYTILRISNIVGLRNNPNNKSHNLFIDNFILYVKNRFIPRYDGVYKDFITIEQFAQIFLLILEKNLKGIFNVSLGRKIFINDITNWLIRHSSSSFKSNKLYYKKKNFNSDSFTLNNSKIKKALNISIKKNELKNYCLYLSKKIFFNKKKKYN
jgi:nucleoside-diphosphate-sugar epimerase